MMSRTIVRQSCEQESRETNKQRRSLKENFKEFFTLSTVFALPVYYLSKEGVFLELKASETTIYGAKKLSM